jgi:hypothetical protein
LGAQFPSFSNCPCLIVYILLGGKFRNYAFAALFVPYTISLDTAIASLGIKVVLHEAIFTASLAWFPYGHNGCKD